MVEEVVPPSVDFLQGAVHLRLRGLVAGQQQLLSQVLQVTFVLTEQVNFLHAVLRTKKKKVFHEDITPPNTEAAGY